MWDAGHLVLFGLLSFSYFSRPSKTRHSILYKIVFTTIACLVVGTAIEFMQLLTNRDFSRSDIINDMLGGYLGLLALLILKKQQTLKLKSTAVILTIICLALGLRDLEKHLLDEYDMHQQLPLLAGFETQLEMSRWENKLTHMSRSPQFIKTGNHSLKATFLPGRYPNISLQHMKSDWSEYNKLIYSVYNPTQETLNFSMKVYDQKHNHTGRHYTDRFNQTVSFKPGWNTIEIPLTDIINSPKDRYMDIQQIKGISLFTDKLKQPVSIYIDDIRLQK